MVWLAEKVVRFLKAEDGPTAVEYAMVVMLIVIVCISAVMTIGQTTDGSFRHSGQKMANAFEARP